MPSSRPPRPTPVPKSSYVPAKPTPGKGQPVAGALSFQDQYSITGQQALRMHDYVLMPIITVITLFVLVLLLFVMARFRRGANPVASKTSHNTLIEVIWTCCRCSSWWSSPCRRSACSPRSTRRRRRTR
jgi:cytochrome c oxidase subunit 2